MKNQTKQNIDETKHSFAFWLIIGLTFFGAGIADYLLVLMGV